MQINSLFISVVTLQKPIVNIITSGRKKANKCAQRKQRTELVSLDNNSNSLSAITSTIVRR